MRQRAGSSVDVVLVQITAIQRTGKHDGTSGETGTAGYLTLISK